MVKVSAKATQGKIALNAGYVDGKRLMYIAQAPRCDRESCPIGEECPSSRKHKTKCLVIRDFAMNLFFDLVDPETGLGDVLSQIQINRIGVHLIPLYLQYIRFFIETINLEKTYYEDNQGRKYVWPQFKALREARTAIKAELNDLKIDALWERKFGNLRPVPGSKTPTKGELVSAEKVSRDGQAGAYEKLFDDGE